MARWPDEHHQHLPGRDRRQAAARRHRAAAGVGVRGRQPAAAGHVRAALPRSQTGWCWRSPGPRSARWSRSASRSPTAAQPEPLIAGEVTALEAEFDSSGTFTVIRGYDQAHRLFRGRRTASYTRSPPPTSPPRSPSGPACRSARSTSTSTVFDHLSQAGLTDWELLYGLARARSATRSPYGRQVRLRRRRRSPARPRRRAAPPARTRWCCSWARTCCGSARCSPSAEQVERGRGPRLGRGDQEGAHGDRAGHDDQRDRAADRDPADARQGLRRPDLRGHRRPLPHPGRGRRGGQGARRRDRRRVRRVRGRRARATRNCGPARRSAIDGAGRAVRRQVHHHHLPAPLRPDHRLHHVVLGDRPAGAQPARAWPRAAAAAKAPAGHRDRPGQRRQRPARRRAGSSSPSRGCRTTTSATGRGPCSPAPARTAARMVLPEVGDEVLVAFEQGDIRPPVRARRPLQRRGHHAHRAGRPDRRRLRRGSTGARWCPGGATGST